MSLYSIKTETLTGIGDSVRALSGKNDSTSPAVMRDDLIVANEAVEAHTVLINKILKALNMDEVSAFEDAFLSRTLTEYANDRITEIGYSAFRDCNMVSVNCPKVTKVGAYAFYSCSNLTAINLPKVETLGIAAFRNCSGLTEVSFPELVDASGNYVFMGCTKLTSIDAPSLKTTGLQFLSGCAKLTNINLPSVEASAVYCFRSCTALEEIKLDSCLNLGNYSFQYCEALKKADFPVLTLIQSSVFNGCPALETLIIRSASVCTLRLVGALNGTPIANGTGYIYVPSELVDSYKAATNWSTFADQIRAIEDYPEITGGVS